MGLSSVGNSATISYFGPMTFLDYQFSFTSVFDPKPQFFGPNSSRLDTGDISEKIRVYAEKCMFDVFLTICREDYVVTDDGTSDSKMIHEICQRLSKLRMEWRSEVGNHLITCTPDELYAKFIDIIVDLPEDVTAWPLPLCNTYLSALITPLQDKIEDNNFRIPTVRGLTIRTLHLVYSPLRYF